MILAFQTVLYALFVWYLSTGVILYLDGLAVRSFRWSMLGVTIVTGVALCGLSATRSDSSVAGAYAAFTCGVLAWAWQEMAFLMGFLTGPRPHGSPEGCSGWARFGYAVQAVLWHELAIAAGAVLVVAASWGGPNQVGVWTFMILWGMRQSAKLNVFLGVRNLNEDLLPAHLAFLKSYLACKPMNLLFPASVTGATLLCILLIQRAASPGIGAGAATGLTLLATMAVLGLVEHWVLVLPVPFARLWDWSLGARSARGRGIPWPSVRQNRLTTPEPEQGPVQPQGAR